jgi:hypothetical protein
MKSETSEALSTCSITAPLVEIAIEKTSPEYLNNFFCSVTGGFYRSNTIQNVFLPGETFGQLYRRTSTNGHAHDGDLQGYTDKKLEMTPAEFFDHIDQAMESKGISKDHVAMLQKAISASGNDLRIRHQLLSELHDVLFPVYLKLRIDGFSHRDLVG